jgi:TP901 family phage tail tape measure protein
MATIAELMVKMGMDNSDFNRGIAQTESKANSAFKNIGKFAMAGAAVGGAAAVAMAGKSLAEFANFEKGMQEVYTLLPDISGDAMGEMEQQVKDFAREFGVLPEKTIPALYQAISAGVPQDNVFEFLEVAQKAAKGGVTELEVAVDGITSVINAYGTDVLSAAQASDLMFTAVKKGKTTFDELSQSLFQVIPTASALGVEFGDVTAALASMTAQGTPTRVATTQLRQLFVELSRAGGEAATTFESMSGKTFSAFVREGGNVAEALQLMQIAADEQNVSMADMFGSVEAGNAALALSGKNMEGFIGNLEEMGNAAGATDAAFNTMNQGVSVTMEKIKSSVSIAMIEVGERLAPTFERFGNWVIENMPAIEDTIVGVFEGVESIVDGVVAVFDAAHSAIEAVIDILAPAIKLYKEFIELSGWEYTGSKRALDQESGTYSTYIPPTPKGGLSQLAEGGIVTRPTVAMVGEAGPEAVLPLDKNLLAILGQNKSENINLTIQIDGQTLARQTYEQFRREDKLRGTALVIGG